MVTYFLAMNVEGQREQYQRASGSLAFLTGLLSWLLMPAGEEWGIINEVITIISLTFVPLTAYTIMTSNASLYLICHL